MKRQKRRDHNSGTAVFIRPHVACEEEKKECVGLGMGGKRAAEKRKEVALVRAVQNMYWVQTRRKKYEKHH